MRKNFQVFHETLKNTQEVVEPEMSIHLISDRNSLTRRGVNAEMSRKKIFDFLVDNRFEPDYYLIDARTSCV